jgi:hypothetical protein
LNMMHTCINDTCLNLLSVYQWENLHNCWLTKYFFLPYCIYSKKENEKDNTKTL